MNGQEKDSNRNDALYYRFAVPIVKRSCAAPFGAGLTVRWGY
jgi:hypothetical protein